MRTALALGRVAPAGQITRPLCSTLFRMAASRAHRESVAGTIGALLPLRRNRHRAFQNEQVRVEFMGMLGIDCICLHATIEHFAITLLAQLGLENRPLHLHSPDFYPASS